jgi:cytochrome c oxidase cbb3-type subunit 4
MDINFLRIVVTIVALATFVGIVWWAYGPARRERFERDALLPFTEEDVSRGAADRGDYLGPSPRSPLPGGAGKGTAGNGSSAISRMSDGSRP